LPPESISCRASNADLAAIGSSAVLTFVCFT